MPRHQSMHKRQKYAKIIPDEFYARGNDILADTTKDRSQKQEKLIEIANKFIRTCGQVIAKSLCKDSNAWQHTPQLIAILSEQLADFEPNDEEKSELFHCAVYCYVLAKDIENARVCAAKQCAVLSHQVTPIDRASNERNQKKSPVYCAVIFEALALQEEDIYEQTRLYNVAAFGYARAKAKKHAKTCMQCYIDCFIEQPENTNAPGALTVLVQNNQNEAGANLLYVAILIDVAKDKIMLLDDLDDLDFLDYRSNLFMSTVCSYVLANEMEEIRPQLLAAESRGLLGVLFHKVDSNLDLRAEIPLLAAVMYEMYNHHDEIVKQAEQRLRAARYYSRADFKAECERCIQSAIHDLSFPPLSYELGCEDLRLYCDAYSRVLEEQSRALTTASQL